MKNKNVGLLFTLCFIGVISALFLFNYSKWKTQVTGGGDSWGYYTYLPATFIHQDLSTLEKVIAIRASNHPHSVRKSKEGIDTVSEASLYNNNHIIKYTYGLSVFYAPGFLMGHIYASLSNSYEANGYTTPYILMLYLSTWVYVLMGLWLLGMLLSKWFTKWSMIATLLILALGTNLFYFMVLNNVMAHPILFFLWASLLYMTDSYYSFNKTWKFVLLAFLVGMITIIRPVEMFALLIVIFWNVHSFTDLINRFVHFINNYQRVLLAILVGILTIAPQLIYWKKLTSSWFYDSYPGEGFDFSNPHIIEGLFGFMNGWLPYSPLMVFSIIGLILMIWKRKSNAGLIGVLTIGYIYLIYCWWNWYYINGYGSRPMVDIYPLLAIPMCYFLDGIFSKSKTIIAFILITPFIVLNLFQTHQHKLGIMWTEQGNLGYYLQAFGKTQFDQKMSIAMDLNEHQNSNLDTIENIYHNDFEIEELDYARPDKSKSGEKSYLITKDAKNDFGTVRFAYDELFKDDQPKPSHLIVKFWIYVDHQIGGFYNYDSIIFEYERSKANVYKRRYLRLNNKPGEVGDISIWWGSPNQWYPVEAKIRLSSRFKSGQHFTMRFNQEDPTSKVFIDDLMLYTAIKK